ncbi:hypothetical protein ACFWBH_24785 [Streptomyces sp. NPDC059999]|uniref:hypothetical protein n=1 Tax=Streptomyces sp. NPDC059999 TaxID=3347030 RepID=UPI00369A6159
MAEVCQARARHIPHIIVLAKGNPALPAPTAPVAAQPAQRAAAPGGFSSPEPAPDPHRACADSTGLAVRRVETGEALPSLRGAGGRLLSGAWMTTRRSEA